MKVLRIIPTMNPSYGGPCQGIRSSIPELAKIGIVNEVVCLDDAGSDFLKNDSFVIHAIGAAKGFWGYNNNLINWLYDNIDKYDVIIVHTLWLYHGYAANKVVRTLRQRSKSNNPIYYVMPHGMLDPYFQNAKGRKLKAIRNWIYWKVIERRLINEADGILFTCEEEMKLAKHTFNKYLPKKEINIGYGISAPPLNNQTFFDAFYNKLDTPIGKSYILFLSRIHIKKGVDLLISAYSKILENEVNINNIPDLVIAGPGIETEFGKSIVDSVKANKIMINKVHFPGMLTSESKWGAFYGCEAFILPSHQENFGISVVEALACSKPVLITDKINIHYEIAEEKAGIVDDDTEIGIYRLLEKWLNFSDTEKKVISKNALDAYLKLFRVEHAALNLKKELETNL